VSKRIPSTLERRRVQSREWYHRNKKRVGEKRRKRYRTDKAWREYQRFRRIEYANRNGALWARAKKYGLEQDELELMLDRGCQICGASGDYVTLHVDHDHETGHTRGILCEHCNFGVGKFYNDPMLLIAAADYLTRDSLSRLPNADV